MTEIDKIEMLEIDKIDRPVEGARLEINEEAIKELAESIKERGQLTPIRVQRRGDRFEVIFGDRRFLACVSLGKKTIKGIVVDMGEKDVLIDRATENIQRVDLSPVEEAEQYWILSEEGKVGFDKIGKMVGKSVGSIKRSMNILGMPEYLKVALHKGLISKAVAEELEGCPDESHKEYLCEMAVEHGITKAVARQWVNDYKKSLRGGQVAGDGGGGLEFSAPMEKTFVQCVLCEQPLEIQKAVHITVCPGCRNQLYEIIKG